MFVRTQVSESSLNDFQTLVVYVGSSTTSVAIVSPCVRHRGVLSGPCLLSQWIPVAAPVSRDLPVRVLRIPLVSGTG